MAKWNWHLMRSLYHSYIVFLETFLSNTYFTHSFIYSLFIKCLSCQVFVRFRESVFCKPSSFSHLNFQNYHRVCSFITHALLVWYWKITKLTICTEPNLPINQSIEELKQSQNWRSQSYCNNKWGNRDSERLSDSKKSNYISCLP